MSGMNAAPPLVVPSRRGRPGTWLRGRATPAGADRVHARRWAILAVLCLSVFLALVDNTIVNVALPSISRQLHATTSDLQWIVDAYSLVFASLLLMMFTPTKWTHHYGVYAGLAGSLGAPEASHAA